MTSVSFVLLMPSLLAYLDCCRTEVHQCDTSGCHIQGSRSFRRLLSAEFNHRFSTDNYRGPSRGILRSPTVADGLLPGPSLHLLHHLSVITSFQLSSPHMPSNAAYINISLAGIALFTHTKTWWIGLLGRWVDAFNWVQRLGLGRQHSAARLHMTSYERASEAF